MHFRILLPALALALALTACGGGGSDSGGGGTTPPAPSQFVVSTATTAGGSISPSSATVTAGQTTSFTVTPAAGYQLGQVTGCNGTLSGQTYTTGAINAACTVSATFTLLQYTVSASAGANGSITPLSQQVGHGRTATLNVQPNRGFDISSVTGCGGKLEGSTYTTGPITENCNVVASFGSSQFTVTMQVGSGGKASIATQQVAYGTLLDVVFTPDTGFTLTNASGCGGVLRENTLKTRAITAACTITASFNPADQVVLPDANLAAVVRKALNLAANAPISKTQAAALTTLDATSASITNLQGLQHFTGLVVLELNYNNISDLYPIRALTRLDSLYLRDNALITDLTPLAGLSRLKTLWIFGATATDLTPLQNLPLVELGLENKQVFDLTPLRNMALQRFYLWNSATSDLSPLANAPLQSLSLYNSAVTNISLFTNLVNLNYFSADNTDIADISVLRQSKGFYTVSLNNTKVTDVDTLAALTYFSRANLLLSGCLDTNGYSRHLTLLETLKTSKNVTVDTSGGSRNDCPDTLAGASFTLTGTVTNRQLTYNWQISGSSQQFQCAAYLDLDDQLPGTPVVSLQDCAASGQRVLTGRSADQFRLAVLFDNGIGGEKLVKVTTELGAAPTAPQLQSMDLSQITLSNKPMLTQGRDGLLRLHVTAAQSPAVLPVVTVQATLNGVSQTLSAKAPARLPASKVHRSLTDNYQLQVPANLMQAGLQLTALIDGQVAQTLTPRFADKRPLAIRIVPFQLGTSVATLPSTEQVATTIKTFWPFSDVTVRTRAPYVLNAQATGDDILDELADLRSLEKEQVYYYGYFKSEMTSSQIGGLGFVGFPAAIGVDTDSSGTILAHELGHNFGRNHVDCGNPSGPDKGYPYSPNTVGSVGLSLDFSSWKSPDQYKDVMSYCSPQHVSDYNVAAVQDFVLKNPPAAFSKADSAAGPLVAAAASAGRALYIAGQLDGSQLQIRTMLPLNRAPQYVAADALHKVVAKVQDKTGIWYQFNAQLLRLDHLEQAAPRFMLELPYLDVARLELWQDGQLLAALAAADNNAAAATANSIAGQPVAAAALSANLQLTERNNEVCLSWPASSKQTLSVLHRGVATADSSGVTVLALNETNGQFCRPTTDLPAGGEWRLIWREQLSVREFVQAR